MQVTNKLKDTTLMDLAQRIDESGVSAERAQEVLEAVKKAPFPTSYELKLSDLDATKLDAPTKDLVALGLLLKKSPLTRAEMGKNLKSTFESLPELKAKMESALNEIREETKTVAEPMHLPVTSSDVHRRDPFLDHKFTLTARPGERPTGILVTPDAMYVQLKESWRTIRNGVGHGFGLRTGQAEPAEGSITGLMPLSGLTVTQLEGVLKTLPPKVEHEGVMKGVSALIPETTDDKVRDALHHELALKLAAKKQRKQALIGQVSKDQFDALVASVSSQQSEG